MSDAAFSLVWILGAAVIVVALFTLLGRKPGRPHGRRGQVAAPSPGKVEATGK